VDGIEHIQGPSIYSYDDLTHYFSVLSPPSDCTNDD